MAYRAPNRGTPPTGIGGDTYDSSADKLFSNTFELFTYLGCDPETGALPDAIPVSCGGTGGNTPQQARDSLSLYSKDETDSKLTQVVQSTEDSIAAVNDKVKPITEGGTGANNVFNARSNLDVYSKSEVDSLVAAGGEGNVVGVAGGGTGATTVAEARTNLGVMSSTEVETAINSATPQATETVLGVAKIATTAIAQAGVNDTDFLTAKKLRDVLNAEGAAPISACRAWVCFDSTTAGVVIRASANIQSVVRTSVGKFVITFVDEMPHSDYIVLTGTRADASTTSTLNLVVDEAFNISTQNAKTTKTLRVMLANYTGMYDSYGMSLGVVC